MDTDREIWVEIRRRVLVDGLSQRAACREFDIPWDTLQKIRDHPEPPGSRRTTPRARTKLDPFLPVIYQILEAEQKAPRKQRHTARRLFERSDGMPPSETNGARIATGGDTPFLRPPVTDSAGEPFSDRRSYNDFRVRS